MVAEVDAMYAETRAETGLAAMSPAVRRALGKVERHRLVPPSEAAAPRVPLALVEQLKPGGRMVIPVGGGGDVQWLRLITRRADGGYDEKRVLPVRFVPLVPGK